jgi:hypothetical protein
MLTFAVNRSIGSRLVRMHHYRGSGGARASRVEGVVHSFNIYLLVTEYSEYKVNQSYKESEEYYTVCCVTESNLIVNIPSKNWRNDAADAAR